MTTPSFQQQYAELVNLTQLFLLQEFSIKDWKMTDLETYSFFKQFAQQKKKTPLLENTHPPSAPIIKPIIKEISQKPSPLPLVQQPPQEIAQKPEIIPEATPSSQEYDLSDIRKTIAEKFPSQVLLEQIPSDEEAKKISLGWQTPKQPDVIILSFEHTEQELTFLTKVAQAIQDRLASTSVISVEQINRENGWTALLESKQLRLIIASRNELLAHPELSKHYRKIEQPPHDCLNQVPLYLLSDLSLYLTDTTLKQTLWRDLRNIL